MLNIHIGVPGVYPDLLHDLSEQPFFKEFSDCHFLSRTAWKANIRSLVNTDMKESLSKDDAVRAANIFSLDPTRGRFLAASQAAFLGDMEDCFLRKDILPRAELRLQNFSRISENLPVTYHLAIPCQFDYFVSAVRKKRLSSVRYIPSWSGLVERLRLALPMEKFVVWSFERPEKVILAFVVSIINNHDELFVSQLKKWLVEKFRKESTAVDVESSLRLSDEISFALDSQFERDLNIIGDMERVVLMLPKDIPLELHL